ncbi:MAG: hypothetical protein QGH83_03050 [Candidatus Pacebacteria bacterium]|jgi:hypothetical protein|nr:hypothetical protein [Candidatus Paceibacterota bacterium]|tara:strand:- start:917 stop:1264 length:348 start_codon:yes stop_codon:yes gene_type:complete
MCIGVPNFLESVKKLSKEEYIDHLKYKYEVNTVTENDRITTGDGNNHLIQRCYHLYSWERIYHFSCGNCKDWWSYATTEDSYKWKSRKMTCPHCGNYTNIKPNPEMIKGKYDNMD